MKNKLVLIIIITTLIITTSACGSKAVMPLFSSPHIALGLTLDEFAAKWDSSTNLQQEDFIRQCVGKWVNWSSTIEEIRVHTIFIEFPGKSHSVVYFSVPTSTVVTLHPGQLLHFMGRIPDIYAMSGNDLNLALDNVQIIPNLRPGE